MTKTTRPTARLATDQYIVYLVNNAGTRARVGVANFLSDVTLGSVIKYATAKYGRFVILDGDVQHYHSHDDDSNGTYMPL